MNLEFTENQAYSAPKIYLCNPDKKELCLITGVNRKCTLRLNSISELTLDVYKKLQNIKGKTIFQPGYSLIEGKRLLFVEGIGYFEIKKAVELDDESGVYKSITAESHQSTLQNKNISIEDRIYRFYNPQDPYDEKYDGSVESVPSIIGQLYQQLGIHIDLQYQDNPATTDYDNWTITYIDDVLRFGNSETNGVYRTFKSGLTNGYDFIVNELETAFEVIVLFDFLHHSIQIKYIKDITEPTDIYLSFDNLLNTVEVTEDASKIVTVLNCSGNDLDIRAVNPMGTNYIVNFDYYMGGNWISNNLTEAIKEWKTQYKNYENDYKNLVLRLREKYQQKTELAQEVQESQLRVDTLCTARDQYLMNYPLLAETVMEGGRSADINSIFYLELFDKNRCFDFYKSPPIVENKKYIFNGAKQLETAQDAFEADFLYFQDNDTDTFCKLIKADGKYGFERYGQYEQVLDWCLCSEQTNIVSVVEYVKKNGNSFHINSTFYNKLFNSENAGKVTCYQSAPKHENGKFSFDFKSDKMIGTLSECGNAGYKYFSDGVDNSYCIIEMAAEVVDGKENYFANGLIRYGLITQLSEWIDINEKYNLQLKYRDSQLELEINNVLDEMKDINSRCNILRYMKNKDDSLYKELESYWIEGDYENTNLAVLDTTTIEEEIDLALELKENGEKQLERVSQPSFSFNVGSIDFLKLFKFKKFISQLKLGRIITIEKEEGVLFTPAITEYSFDLDNAEDLTLTFSNSARLNSNEFTFADLVGSNSDVSNKVISNWQDLTDYSKHKDEITNLIANPLNKSLRAGLTNMVNQEFTIDQTGILGRKYTDITKVAFTDEQMRIMNNSILFTDDNWQSVKTALGKIYYEDDGEEKSSYGLVAETLIGSLIMSETMKIKNKESSIVLDKNGIVIKKGNEIVLNAQTNGDLQVVGEITALSGYIGTKQDGFRITSKAITYNMDDDNYDANDRIYIGTGNDSIRPFTVGNHKNITNLMLLAGKNFAVTREGLMYVNAGYISEIQVGEMVVSRNNGNYVKFSTDVYSQYENVNGDMVDTSDNIVLFDSIQKYAEYYTRNDNGEFVFVDGMYININELSKHGNDMYVIDESGTYIIIDGIYINFHNFERYNLSYEVNAQGEYIKINNEYFLLNNYKLYKKEYIQDENGEYLYFEGNFYKLNNSDKYNLIDEKYVQNSEGNYLKINDENYILISEYLKYTIRYTENSDGKYIFDGSEYLNIESVIRYNKTYTKNSSGSYVKIDNDYYLIETTYRKDFYVISDSRLVLFSSLQRYDYAYVKNATGSYIHLKDTGGDDHYILGTNLTTFDENGEPAVEISKGYGLYGAGFKLETAGETGSAVMNFWDNNEDEPTITINGRGGIKAQQATFDKLCVLSSFEAETFTATAIATGGGLSMCNNKISFSDDDSAIYFGVASAGGRYYARLETEWWSRLITLRIYDANGNVASIPETKTFKVHFAVIWGGDTVWNATVYKGSQTATKDTKAFWGIDYTTFSDPSVNRNNRTQWFTMKDSSGEPNLAVQGNFSPKFDKGYKIGTSGCRWKELWTDMAFTTSGSCNKSDRNSKKDIKDLDIKYSKLFDKLRPVSYKLKEGESGRTHTGFIAQELKDSLGEIGLTTNDLAAYCEWTDEKGNVTCGIRYEELIALTVLEIKKLKERIKELEDEISTFN